MKKAQINGYTLEHKIQGKSVYLASKGKQKYVLKLSASPSLKNEFFLLNEIQNECIIPVNEYFIRGELHCFSMPVAKGDDLLVLISTFVSHQRFIPEETVRSFMKQIFSAISHIHKHGIIHRDISPENILFLDSEKKKIVLADFGLACRDPTENKLTGTGPYQAPEIFERRPYNNKVDCWAAGIVMYMLLYRMYPFFKLDKDGNVSKDWYDEDKIKRADLKFDEDNIDISYQAMDLIKKLICVDPDLRFSAAQALEHPWFKHTPNIIQETSQFISRIESEVNSANDIIAKEYS